MTSISDIEKQIAELQKQVDALKAKPEGRWKPIDREYYWYVDDLGDVEDCCYRNDREDNLRYLTRNCFKTKEEAEVALKTKIDYWKLINELEAIADGFVPDWCDGDQVKYYLQYNSLDREWELDCTWKYQYTSWPVFATAEQAERAIALGDRLDVLLKGGAL